MSNPINLIVYHSRLFPAHWAIWIPQSPGPRGAIIQVEGNPSSGFTHDIERDYDPSEDSRLHSIILLGMVDGDMDVVERVALSIPAPGPSLRRRFGPEPKSRIKLRNCQTWVREFVDGLIEEGVLSEEACDAVDQAPKN